MQLLLDSFFILHNKAVLFSNTFSMHSVRCVEGVLPLPRKRGLVYRSWEAAEGLCVVVEVVKNARERVVS